MKQVRIVQVIAPPTSPVANNSKKSPIRVSVITTPPSKLSNTSPSQPQNSPSSSSNLENPLEGLTNGLPHLPNPGVVASSSDSKASVPEGKETKTKGPQTPKSPLSPEIHFDPAQYKYVVEFLKDGELMMIVKASVLSRPRGALTPKKLKLFLRNATYRSNDKFPFAVKVRIGSMYLT